MKEFVIKGKSVPSKKNSKQIFVRRIGGKYIPIVQNSDLFNKWHDEAIVQILQQKMGFYTERCKVVITFYFGDNRLHDLDNGVSSVFDTLKDAGVIKDDNRFVIPCYFVFSDYDPQDPRCVVQIFDKDEPVHFPERFFKGNELFDLIG